MRKKTNEEFIRDARIIHGDKYDYSMSKYVNNKVKVAIVCKEHGVFYQKPNGHLDAKQGCPYCKRVKNYTTEEFVEIVNKIHNGFYDFSNVVYTNNRNKVEVRCPVHGIFHATPKVLMRGCGCSLCGDMNKKIWNAKRVQRTRNITNRDGYCYIVNLFNEFESFCKVGSVSSGHLKKKRYEQLRRKYNLRVLNEYELPFCDAFDMEDRILSKVERYIPKQKFQGYTECFSLSSMNNLMDGGILC